MTATIQDQIFQCLSDGPLSCAQIARILKKDYDSTASCLKRLQKFGQLKRTKYEHGEVEWSLGEEGVEVDTQPVKRVRKAGAWGDVPIKLNWWEGTSSVRIWESWRK